MPGRQGSSASHEPSLAAPAPTPMISVPAGWILPPRPPSPLLSPSPSLIRGLGHAGLRILGARRTVGTRRMWLL